VLIARMQRAARKQMNRFLELKALRARMNPNSSWTTATVFGQDFLTGSARLSGAHFFPKLSQGFQPLSSVDRGALLVDANQFGNWLPTFRNQDLLASDGQANEPR
jgi:hypothetical protein